MATPLSRAQEYILLFLCASSPIAQAHGDETKPALMKLPTPYTVAGQPILGTYSVSNMEELRRVKSVGMNLILGGEADLDPNTDRGRFCAAHGIKVMHHMTQHLYGKPRLRQAISADEATIPLREPAGKRIPKRGLIRIEDELITYRNRTDTELKDCTRGARGTTAAPHHEGIILFWPEACEAEVRRVKESPNLWGYYVLDDSPGDALSALRAMYRVIRRVDGPAKKHPVCAGYGSAGSLCNFGPEVCDIMMIYWYPVSSSGYNRLMTSREVQWMMGYARRIVPGIPFVGIYQAFNGGSRSVAIPTRRQLREQLEDFVREGACGLVAFLARGKEPLHGWAAEKHMQEVLRAAHREIRTTGGLTVRAQPEAMRRTRVQPIGHWTHPREVAGIVPAWYVIGAFDDKEKKRSRAVFPPEKKIDLEGVYRGKSGKVRWIQRRSFGGVVGLGEIYGSHAYSENVVAYATCTVTSPRKQSVQMRFGSDDDAVVWVGGKQVWRHEGTRGIQRDDDLIDAVLQEGANRILVKVCNRGGMWAFFMRFTDRERRPVPNLTFSPCP